MAGIPLITRADDFGSSPGANDAILECLDAGFIRNVGVMAPGPFLRHRLDDLVARQDSACIGIHATLTSEWANLRWGPVADPARVPSLVREDGTFHADTQTLHQRGGVAEMLAEVRAQVRLLGELGLRPRYLDTHMGFNWIDGVAAGLAELCRAEGLLYANGTGFAGVRLAADHPSPPGPQELLSALQAGAQPGRLPVWVFHPARRDPVSERFFTDPARPSTAVAVARDREYRFLADAPRITAFARAAGVKPAGYRS